MVKYYKPRYAKRKVYRKKYVRSVRNNIYLGGRRKKRVPYSVKKLAKNLVEKKISSQIQEENKVVMKMDYIQDNKCFPIIGDKMLYENDLLMGNLLSDTSLVELGLDLGSSLNSNYVDYIRKVRNVFPPDHKNVWSNVYVTENLHNIAIKNKKIYIRSKTEAIDWGVLFSFEKPLNSDCLNSKFLHNILQIPNLRYILESLKFKSILGQSKHVDYTKVKDICDASILMVTSDVFRMKMAKSFYLSLYGLQSCYSIDSSRPLNPDNDIYAEGIFEMAEIYIKRIAALVLRQRPYETVFSDKIQLNALEEIKRIADSEKNQSVKSNIELEISSLIKNCSKIDNYDDYANDTLYNNNYKVTLKCWRTLLMNCTKEESMEFIKFIIDINCYRLYLIDRKIIEEPVDGSDTSLMNIFATYHPNLNSSTVSVGPNQDEFISSYYNCINMKLLTVKLLSGTSIYKFYSSDKFYILVVRSSNLNVSIWQDFKLRLYDFKDMFAKIPNKQIFDQLEKPFRRYVLKYLPGLSARLRLSEIVD